MSGKFPRERDKNLVEEGKKSKLAVNEVLTEKREKVDRDPVPKHHFGKTTPD
jgi:hypothetical protein